MPDIHNTTGNDNYGSGPDREDEPMSFAEYARQQNEMSAHASRYAMPHTIFDHIILWGVTIYVVGWVLFMVVGLIWMLLGRP